MCRSSGCQCVGGIVSSIVQKSSGRLPVDVNFCRMHFDPREVKTSRGCLSQLRYKLGPQVCIAFSLTLQGSSSKRTTFSLSDLISSFRLAHASRRSPTKFRTVVGLLPGKGERAIPVITDAEQTLQPTSEPRILTADACTISPRHNGAVISSFTFKALCLVVHLLQCLPKRPPWRLRGMFHISMCTAVSADGLDCLALVFHGE